MQYHINLLKLNVYDGEYNEMLSTLKFSCNNWYILIENSSLLEQSMQTNTLINWGEIKELFVLGKLQ